MEFLIFGVAMGFLIYGADLVVKESEHIALKFNIPPFIIGATLIALGTSLPEMAASVTASYNHKSDLAVSNVLGSSIFNIVLILGLVFIFSKKVAPKRDLFAKDSAWAIFPIIIFIIMVYSDNLIGRFDGVLFVLLMVAYVLFLVKDAKELVEGEIDSSSVNFSYLKSCSLLLIGFLLIIFGADYSIESASNIAKSFNVSEWLIGIFLISFGTSLPELIVSIVAAKSGNSDMSIGNIIGSNVANFTIVLGSSAIVNPLFVDFHKYSFDILVTFLTAFMLLLITANRLYNKSAGIALLIVLALFLQNSISDVL